MNSSELESNLDRIHEWVKAADQKASIWLAFQGVCLTLIAAEIGKLRGLLSSSPNDLLLILLIASFVGVCLGIYKSVTAIIPRLNSKNKEKSLLFFGDIASLSLENFRERLKNYGDGDFRNDLIKQIHVSSLIATKKHRLFRESIFSFLLGIVGLGVVTVICLLSSHYVT